MKDSRKRRIIASVLALILTVQLLPMSVWAEELSDDLSNEEVYEENNDFINQDEVEEIPPEIVSEDISKREENVKHFKLSNGENIAVMYEEPIHYLNDNNEWVDYDNSFDEIPAVSEDEEETEAGGTDYINKSADYSVRFSKKTNGKKFVRLEKDGYKLSWYYTDAGKVEGQVFVSEDDGDPTTLENVSSEVIYKNVYENADLQYIAAPTGIKENIILNSADVQTEFISEYKANGLSPVQVSDQIIELWTEDGTAIYTVSAPFMYDANGERSESVTLSLTEVKNNKFTVKVTVDAEWLSAEERVFPVVVDPSLKTKQKTAVMDSAFVAKGQPDKCYYAYGQQHNGEDSGSLYVGNMGGEYGLTQSYLKFDKLPTLSVADKVTDATFQVTLYKCEVGLQLDIKRVTSSWDTNKVTWNTKPSVNNTILDYKMLSETALGVNKYLYFEITDLVRGWYSGEYANYGVSLSTDKTSSSKAWILSSRYDEFAQKEYRPILQITYRNMSGYEDYWSYTDLPAGRNGHISVNNFNGNLVFSQPVTQGDGGNIMPVNISLIYNSNGVNAPYTYLAKNFQTNYHIYLREDQTDVAQDGFRYYLNDADGTRHWFYFETSSATEGVDEDGLGYTLEKFSKGSYSVYPEATFRILDKNFNEMYFNSEGNLLALTNYKNTSITIQYETVSGYTRMKSITDGVGRVYNFGYHSQYPYLCESISDPSGRKTSFEFWNGCLTKIIFPDGENYTLTYDSNGVLNQVNSIDGTRTKITSDSTALKRVTSIDWGTNSNVLEKYSFTYKQNETYVTDKRSRKFTYQFNDFGQNTGIISNADGRAQFFERTKGDSTDLKTNKLLSSSKVLKSVTNYIVNPGFTRDYSNGFWTYAPDTTGNPTIAIDTSKGNLTSNALKVYKPSNNTKNVMTVQNVSGISAGTYTLSAYVNTNNVTVNGNGVYLGVELRNSAGAMVKVLRAEKIYKTSGWERISLTFDLLADQTVTVVAGFDSGASGTVWFDDFQLEQGTGVSSCNLVENSSFIKGNSAWTYADGVTFSVLGGSMSYLGKYAHIAGDAANKKAIRSDVVSSGKKGDVFSIGGWMKADSAPINNETKDGDSHQPSFGIWVDFINSSGKSVGGKMLNFNADVKDWQFSSAKFIAPADYAKVLVYFSYEYNVNTVDVAGMFCYKEEFGQTYDYDKDGNVASVVDIANTKSSFSYTSDQIAKLINPSGSEYFYSYTDDYMSISEAITTDGQRYSFTYDDKGNVLTVKTEADKPDVAVRTGKKYVIRNAKNSYVLQCAGPYVDSREYKNGYQNQTWELESTGETGIYYLKSPSSNGLYLGVKDTSGLLESGFTTSGTPNGDAYKFKIKETREGSFYILTKKSNYTRCVDGEKPTGADLERGATVIHFFHGNKDSQKWYFYPDISGSTAKQDYIQTSATYTPNGNFLRSVTDSLGNKTMYGYNQTNGTLGSIMDPEGNSTSFTYDPNTNALTKVSSDGKTVNYSYEKDRLSGINVVNGANYKFTYDTLGRKTVASVGNGSNFIPLLSYSYNSYGLLSSQLFGNGDKINYTYDVFDRLTGKSYNNSTSDSILYNYGSDGRLSYITDSIADTRTNYFYDLAGRLRSQRTYDGTDLSSNVLKSSTDFTYSDKTNYLTKVSLYSDLGTQNISYEYGIPDDGERPDSVYSIYFNNAERLNYTYDPLGRVSKKRVWTGSGRSLATSYIYLGNNKNGTQTSNQVRSLSNNAGVYTYSYDKNGNITYIGSNNSVDYYYDSSNQLIREDDAVNGKTYIYTYDNNGNMIKRVEYICILGTPTIDPLSVTTWSYGDGTWKDVLTSYNGEPVTVDEIGNILSIGDTSLSWKGNQLLSVDNNTYKYDMEGRRISKVVSGVKTDFYYNGNTLAGQKCGDNKLIFMCDEKGDPFGFTYNGTEYLYLKNLQNDVVAIVDNAGSIVVKYTYDAWGRPYKATGTLANTIGRINPIRYRSYYYDTETGYYFLGSRYYDPELCRYLNADTNIQSGQSILSYNMFIYAKNNPVNTFIEDSGRSANCGNKEVTPNFYIQEIKSSPLENLIDFMSPAIIYDVPLYDQNGYSLCWAFCQVMVEDYRAGITRTNEQATQRAIEIAISVFGEGKRPDGSDVWDEAYHPLDAGIAVRDEVNSVNDIYYLLKKMGPFYAGYNGKPDGHYVVVTGVNLSNGIIYTNNPWGIYGSQTFKEFMRGYAGMPSDWIAVFDCYLTFK